MTGFDLIPKAEFEHKDGTSHNSGWQDLQMIESNQEDQEDLSLLEFHRRFRI